MNMKPDDRMQRGVAKASERARLVEAYGHLPFETLCSMLETAQRCWDEAEGTFYPARDAIRAILAADTLEEAQRLAEEWRAEWDDDAD